MVMFSHDGLTALMSL